MYAKLLWKKNQFSVKCMSEENVSNTIRKMNKPFDKKREINENNFDDDILHLFFCKNSMTESYSFLEFINNIKNRKEETLGETAGSLIDFYHCQQSFLSSSFYLSYLLLKGLYMYENSLV